MIKFWILIFLVALIFAFSAYSIATQNYPVALIGFDFISAKDFNITYSGAMNYYKNINNLYGKDASVLSALEIKKEIKRAVLNNLIENNIVKKELSSRMSQPELSGKVNQKISDVLNKEKISSTLENFYGFSEEDFKNRVLVPEAMFEILKDQFSLKNEDFNAWLKGAENKANILILIPDFSWDGEHVILKK